MKSEVSKSSFRILLVTMALALLMTSSTLGQRECCQGNMWLKWTHDEREGYTFGYALGYSKGYGGGCRQGTKDWPVEVKGNVEDFPLNKCISKELDFSKGSDFLVKAVTDFYTMYPEDRDIYIDEVLDGLGKGLSLKEIHNYPFPRHNTPTSKP